MTDIPPEISISLWRAMLLVRRFEEHIRDVYGQQEMKTPVHLGIGQEAIYAGVCAHLQTGDYLVSTHRNHGCCLLRGMEPFRLYAELYGRMDGCCGGRGGSMHPASPRHGILGTSAIVGGGVPLATGMALAAHLQRKPHVSAAFFGDGAFDEGSTSESLNFAALHALPVLYVCENNFYATASPQHARQPPVDMWRRVAPVMPARRVDGTDAEAVYRAAGEALASIRAGNGPCFLEVRAYRWMGHVGPDEDWTRQARPREELESWKARCPLRLQEQRLENMGLLDEAGRTRAQEEVDGLLTVALEKARRSPFPSPQTLADNLFRA